MKVSVITVCYNAEKTIATAMASVAAQRVVEVEYIIVDGGSMDGTVREIENFANEVRGGEGQGKFSFRWISEKDEGMYDAINKGVRLATGDVVGILNSDDILATDTVLCDVVRAFVEAPDVDAVYADVRFVAATEGGDSVESLRKATTRRYYSAKQWRPWMHNWGYMPPHPSVYIRREVFAKLGGYRLGYRISADFELMVRYFCKTGIKARYIPQCLVVMRTGGLSTGGWRSNVRLNVENIRANRENGYFSCFLMMLPKYAFKIWEFVFPKKDF